GDDRRDDVGDVDRAGGGEGLLADELDEVGDRLQEAELAGPVGPVAELHPSHHLALDERQVGEQAEEEVDDEERLEQRDPPRLGHGASTSSGVERASETDPVRPCACSAATSATPGRTSRESRARSSSALPFDESVTRSPSAIPRARASARARATSAEGRWNCSSGTRSTAAQ